MKNFFFIYIKFFIMPRWIQALDRLSKTIISPELLNQILQRTLNQMATIGSVKVSLYIFDGFITNFNGRSKMKQYLVI